MKMINPLLVVCLLSACGGAIKCVKAPIAINKLGDRPKPAGRVVVGCDGKVLVEIEADEVVY